MAGPSIFSILDILPQILAAAQTIMYIVLSWIFGSLAMRGMRKDIPLAVRIPVMLGTGFLCVIAGISLSGYMFFLHGTIIQTIQMDMFLGGLAASALLALAFYMITREEGMQKETAERLRERVSLLEGLLLKHKVPTLKEREVMRTAESLVPGFAAKEARLKGSNWEILLEKKGKNARVVLGAYTGDVRMIEHPGIVSEPLRVAGVILIICLLGFSLLTFRGFPNITESIASLLGLSPEQMNALIGGRELPEGCVSTLRVLMKHGISVLGGGNTYEDENTKSMIETETGRQVIFMYRTEFEGKDYILSITFPADLDASNMTNEEVMKHSEICTSTREILCDCIKIPEMGTLTGSFVAVG